MILVSACLLGYNTKYDGGTNSHPLLLEYAAHGQFLPFCPEQLGGLAIPHPAAEIAGGSGEDVLQGTKKVFNDQGNDVTPHFMKGAQKTAALLKKHTITAAIVKQRSPSCGFGQIYDGSFSHTVRPGMGVAAAMLHSLGLAVYTEEDISHELLAKLLDPSTSGIMNEIPHQ